MEDASTVKAGDWFQLKRRETAAYQALRGSMAACKLEPVKVKTPTMNLNPSPALLGQVASLHLHPPFAGEPMEKVEMIEVISGKGILGEPRYFSRRNRLNGQLSPRQISLIERGQIAQHASALGLEKIAPGAVRANIETTGASLISLLGHQIQIGEAVLHLYEPRKPCEKMNAICAGLRSLMESNKQGVLAEVIQSGRIRVGDRISVAEKNCPSDAIFRAA